MSLWPRSLSVPPFTGAPALVSCRTPALAKPTSTRTATTSVTATPTRPPRRIRSSDSCCLGVWALISLLSLPSGLGLRSRPSRGSSRRSRSSTGMRFSGTFDISVKRRDFFESMTPESSRRSSLTLAQRTYEDVRTAIIRGQYPAGSVLAESTLAECLGVSKTPVRHALNLLRQEGFLSPGPRRQLIVAAVSAERRSEILQVRE